MKKIKQDGERQAKFDFAMSIDMIGEFDDRFCFPPSRPDPLFDKYISDNKSSLNPFSDVINDHNVNKVEVKAMAVAEVKKGGSGKDDSRKSKGESKNDYKGCENYMHNYSKMDFSRGEEKTRDSGKEMKQQQLKEDKEKVMADTAKEGKKSESKDEEKKDGVDDMNGDKRWRFEKSGEEKKKHDEEEKHAEEKTSHNGIGGEAERMKEFKDDENCHEDDEEEDDGDDDRESVEKLDGHIISKNMYADVEGVEELGLGVGGGGGVEREMPFNEFLISRGAGQSLSA